MDARGGWLDLQACSTADKRWYAALVANAQDSCCAPDEAHDVLTALNRRPWKECLFMKGDQLDGRYEDINQKLWSDDRFGRWSSKMSGKKLYLHHQIAAIQPNRARRQGDVVSHVCGHCNCIRLEHIRYQTPAEDILDRRHCSKRQKREIRPDSPLVADLCALWTATGSPYWTPHRPARCLSPVTSRDLP